jgi:indolepyruvate ferredoxin oxidoreductase
LTADNLSQVVAIAGIPEDIRGYGHIKQRHLKAAKEKEAALLAALGSTGSPAGFGAGDGRHAA